MRASTLRCGTRCWESCTQQAMTARSLSGQWISRAPSLLTVSEGIRVTGGDNIMMRRMRQMVAAVARNPGGGHSTQQGMHQRHDKAAGAARVVQVVLD